MTIGRRTVLAAPLAATGLLAGCSSGAGDENTLTFLNAHSGAYDNVVEAFEDAHPGVRIELQSVPFEQLVEQIQARLASGDSSIDVMSVDPPRLAGMVEQGFLTDESAHVDAMRENASDVGINSITAQDRQWAYPLWTSDNFLFYHRGVLEAAGVDLPGRSSEDRLTWEQVLDVARAMIDGGQTRYGLAMDQVNRYYAVQPMIESFGASPGLVGEDSLSPAVDAPEWIAFGQWYADLFASGVMPRGVDPAQMVDLFRSGQSAFLLGGASGIGELAEGDFASAWDMAPHPYFEDGPIVTPTDSWAIGISSFSTKQDLAREFVQFATLDPEGARLSSSILSLPPVNPTAFEFYVEDLTALAPHQTKGFAELFRTDSDEYARHRPTSVGYVQFENTMNDAFTDLSTGADVTRVLTDAQQTLERQLARQRELAKSDDNR
ncbi:ABC transporter substrate-binding protein [Brachybacterium sacelli]|uniref:ABC-type glycerol-3-phosphate transport system substrate-binding protein n=1 Tax=Brachybacterium sacelli TaxID=173364 RepID=A0ABS4WYT5_9MICO|nr:sugar ABC transporter substrate-binding protein [Brachybacterium sacelli]MBP2381360.1 ABC-type glycerol-3-phosphate transport system substrate-binding protein [Brachybacterium sacelli]